MDIWTLTLKLLKNIKYFNVDINKHVQDLYAEKDTMQMKEIKEDLHKWREFCINVLKDAK